MSIKAVMGGVTVNNVTNLPIKNKNGATVGTLALSEVDTIATPTATKTINSNGTGIDVTNYAKVDVNVPTGGSTPTYQEKTVTSNGTVTPDSGYDALSKVTVNVPVGITPSGKLNISDTGVKDVTNYAQAQVIDANLVAGNIKSGVSILGVTGAYEAGESSGTIESDLYIDMEFEIASDLEPAVAINGMIQITSDVNAKYFEKVNKIINDGITEKSLYYCRLEYVGENRSDLQTYVSVFEGVTNGVSPLSISSGAVSLNVSSYANGVANNNSILSLQVDTRDAQTRGIKINYRKNFTFNEFTMLPSGKYNVRFGRM